MMLPHYDEKTGDPTADNWARKWNKRLRRAATNVKFEGRSGRRRKKYVLGQERSRYVVLLNETILDLMKQDARGT